MSPSTAPPAAEFGDIVVTANKREQSLRDVGLSITALSGEQLERQNVSGLDDLTRTVPNLSFQPTAFATPVFTLRGIGFYDSSLSSYPAVATYIDQIPLTFPSLATHIAFDLERMEVLKGPQGTLFGASSTGGAINFIAAKPTSSFEYGADLTYGRFDRVEGDFYISGPITDRVRTRIAVNAVRQDGWQISQTRPEDRNAKQRYVAARVILDWEASNNLKFELSANGFYDEGEPQAPQFKTYNPQRDPANSPLSGPYANFPFAPDNARIADWDTVLYTNATGSEVDGHPRGLQKMGAVALRGDLNLGQDLTLTSITSYANYYRDVLTESDGTPLLATDYISTGRINSFNQELRLSNSARSRFRWIVGGNYEHTNTREAFINYWQVITLRTPANSLLSGYRARMSQQLRNYAVFANGEFDLLPQVTINGGIRYTENLRRVRECSFDNGDGSFNSLINTFGARVAAAQGVPFRPVTGLDCAEIDDVTFDGTPASFNPGEFRGRLKEDNVSWRGGISYKPNPSSLIYFTVAKGYKAGTYPFIGGTNFGIHTSVTQESLLDFEGGTKLQLLDRKLSLNIAGFYYKYTDKQLRSRVPDSNFGALNSMIQVPKSTLYGVEAEANVQPTPGLSLALAGTYTHSRVDRYTGFAASGVPPTVTTPPTDFRGSILPYVSKYQFAASGDYTWEMADLRPFLGFTATYRSSQTSAVGGSRGVVIRPEFRSQYPLEDIFRIPGYALLDLRAGVAGPDDRWSISVFGKNVTNKYYFLNTQPVFDGVVNYTGMPATWGITIGSKFR